MITPTVAGQEEAQLYEELRCGIDEFEEGEQRQIVLNRMIRQLRFAKWRKDRMRKVEAYCHKIKPATLWIILATGALAPVLLFSMFIWVSLWVE
ncbi:hypothetical protein [Paenibacillus sp. FSL K6-2393]|uniref:hypothetical protein n=1 Tax=Paenibacillus sp. FSL K6-2393 TaxID=2921475 RepID=UPI0030F5AF05